MTEPHDSHRGTEPAEDLGWALGSLLRSYRERIGPLLEDVPHGPRGYQTLCEVIRGEQPSQLALATHLGIDRTVMTYLVDDLEKAQTGYTILDKGGSLMPWVTLALLVGGVALVKNRRRAVVLVAAGGVVALILLALGLSVAKTALLD